jgi:1,4-alpha-glucan branching enzyme
MNHEVAWTWDHIYPLEKRFLESLQRLKYVDVEDDSWHYKTFEQAGRELLLLEASDWQFIITTKGAIDYSTKRFHEHALNLKLLLDLGDRLLDGIEPDEEDKRLINETNHANPLFAEINIEHWL